MDTLVVEKALEDVRGLQGELAGFGVPVELEDSDADGAVAAIRILPNGRFYVGWSELDGVSFDRFRLLTIDSFIRYYERKSGVIGSRWKKLCDGEDEPLPVFLQVRVEKLEAVAVKLRGLVGEED